MLDDVADFFKHEVQNAPGPNFEVIRLPMEIVIEAGQAPHLRSYNNCLIESYDRVRKVYLPRFEDHE